MTSRPLPAVCLFRVLVRLERLAWHLLAVNRSLPKMSCLKVPIPAPPPGQADNVTYSFTNSFNVTLTYTVAWQQGVSRVALLAGGFAIATKSLGTYAGGDTTQVGAVGLATSTPPSAVQGHVRTCTCTFAACECGDGAPLLAAWPGDNCSTAGPAMPALMAGLALGAAGNSRLRLLFGLRPVHGC